MYHYAYCPARYVYMSIYSIAKRKEKYIEMLHTVIGLICNYMSPSA